MENSYILIKGGNRISGSTYVQGSKNACLPLIASAVRLGDVYTFTNVPNISDVFTLLDIYRDYGVKYEYNSGTLKIDSRMIGEPECNNEEKVSSIRASSYLIGSVLPRMKYLSLPMTGGCKIGARPLDIHFDLCRLLGYVVTEKENFTEFYWSKIRPTNIKLRFKSVGATINGILLALDIPGITIIENAALEPEVDSVMDFLVKAGASLERRNKAIIIQSKELFRPIEYRLPFDRIVFGDLLLLAAATRGEIEINGVDPKEQSCLIKKISQTPCQIGCFRDKIYFRERESLHGSVNTAPYPFFPTDSQAQFVAACLASGGYARVKEHVFGSRFGYAEQLKKMNANVSLKKDSLILEKSRVKGGEVEACDLRSGMALIIAALGCREYTRISNLHLIDRGYDDIVGVVNRLGGDIKRIE